MRVTAQRHLRHVFRRAAAFANSHRCKKRDLFAELTEGFGALADQRAGKRTLRTHVVKVKPAPTITARELAKVR